jgi:parvulin-like peptidyl-prolyl isomerase
MKRLDGPAALIVPVLLAVPGAAQSVASPDVDAGTLVATVNGEPLYFEDLELLLAELHSKATMASRDAADVDQLLSRVVNDKLIAQEARALGLDEESPIPEQLAARGERLAVELLEREEIEWRAQATEEELREAFEERYSTITFRVATGRQREDAEELLRRLKAGADFTELAKESSIDSYSARGGLVERLDRNDMPSELADEAFAMEPGQLKGPIVTSRGWSVLRVESIEAADPERFESLQGTLRDLVRFRKAEALRAALGSKLREAHPVSVDNAVLAGIEAQRLPDGRLVPTRGEPGVVVAHVGARTIGADALRQALQLRWSGVANETAALAAKPIVLERLIREELMLAEALRRHYQEAPEVLRELGAYETKLLVARFLSGVIAAGISVTDEEMRQYYEDNQQNYRRPPRLHVGQITVATEQVAARVADLLRQGTDLGWLGRQYPRESIEGPAQTEGWITPRSGGGPLHEALVEAQAGDVLGPMPGDGGFLLARVNTREDLGVYPFEDVSGNVRQAVSRLKTRRAIHEFIQTARDNSEIDIREDVLETLRISGSQAEAAGPHEGSVP